MNTYIKKILFSLLVLVIAVPHMNLALEAMETEDYDSSSVRAHKISFVTEDQQDDLSLMKQSTSSKIASLEDSQTSWFSYHSTVSYLLSPVKVTMQMANEFINLAIRNPKLAMVVGMSYVLPAVSAGCYCVCYAKDSHGGCQGGSQGIGCATNLTECANVCSSSPNHCGIASCQPFCKVR